MSQKQPKFKKGRQPSQQALKYHFSIQLKYVKGWLTDMWRACFWKYKSWYIIFRSALFYENCNNCRTHWYGQVELLYQNEKPLTEYKESFAVVIHLFRILKSVLQIIWSDLHDVHDTFSSTVLLCFLSACCSIHYGQAVRIFIRSNILL